MNRGGASRGGGEREKAFINGDMPCPSSAKNTPGFLVKASPYVWLNIKHRNVHAICAFDMLFEIAGDGSGHGVNSLGIG